MNALVDAAQSEASDEPTTAGTEVFTWRGIRIEVCYVPDWLADYHSHLSITSVEPARAELPITETGYLSHFLGPGIVEARGGPAAYVLAWLEKAAEDPIWKEREAASRQFSLF